MFARYTLRLQQNYGHILENTPNIERFCRRYKLAIAQGLKCAPSFFPARDILRRTGAEKLSRLTSSHVELCGDGGDEQTVFRRIADKEAAFLFNKAAYARLPRGAEKIIASPAFLSRDRFTVLDAHSVSG